MEKTLDQVRQELSEIYEELLTLPADDFERRASLRDRQNELRQESARLVAEQPAHDPERLKQAYERLELMRDHLLDQRMSPGYSTSVGDDGIESTFTDAVNKAMDSGLGLDEVEARLQKILKEMRAGE